MLKSNFIPRSIINLPYYIKLSYYIKLLIHSFDSYAICFSMHIITINYH